MTDFNRTISDLRQRAAAVVTVYGRQLDEIRADADLTSAAKAARIHDLYQRTAGEADRLRQAESDAVSSWTAELESRLFGNTYTTDEVAVANRREAGRIAAALEKESDAYEAIVGAKLQNDKSLVRALGAQAVRRGWASVASIFAESSPDAGNNIRDLQALYALKDDTGAMLAAQIHYSVMKPSEARRRAA